MKEQAERPAGPVCSFSIKASTLTFSKKNADIEKYKNRFVKVYVDQNRGTLAWKFFEHEAREDMVGYSQVKEVKIGTSTQVKMYVPAKIAKAIATDPSLDYSNMPILDYLDSVLDEQPFKYVVFPRKPVSQKGMKEEIKEAEKNGTAPEPEG